MKPLALAVGGALLGALVMSLSMGPKKKHRGLGKNLAAATGGALVGLTAAHLAAKN